MSNPYEAPSSPLGDSTSRRGFPWRIFPAAFFVLFGGLLAVGMPIAFVLRINRPPAIVENLRFTFTLGAFIQCMAGVLWVASGVSFWQRRWWRAAACLLLGYGSGVLGAWLMDERGAPRRKPAIVRSRAVIKDERPEL